MNQKDHTMSDLDTLAMFADLDLEQFNEIRSEVLPMGLFGWNVAGFDFDADDEDGDGNARAKATFTLEVVETQQLLKPEGIDIPGLTGRKHVENFYIKADDMPAGVGRIRAFLSDIGVASTGKFLAACEASVGHKFVAGITHQKDRHDKTRVYARLKLAPAKPARAAANV
jgi:hypothetical protein